MVTSAGRKTGVHAIGLRDERSLHLPGHEGGAPE